jgi:hypothetical protein
VVDEAEMKSGLSIEELAETAGRAFKSAAARLGLPETPGGDAEVGWLGAASWASDFWSRSQDAQAKGEFVAQKVYESFGIAAGQLSPVFAELPAEYRVCWEAAARHLFGAIDCDPDDVRHMADHEAFWGEWVASRVAAGEK